METVYFDAACGFPPRIIVNIINAFCSRLVGALATLLTMELPGGTAGEDT